MFQSDLINIYARRVKAQNTPFFCVPFVLGTLAIFSDQATPPQQSETRCNGYLSATVFLFKAPKSAQKTITTVFRFNEHHRKVNSWGEKY